MSTRPQPEARSLSTINYLAANPPQYPSRPELRESLTLYISRVAGTQDIILSTFRPHKKTVTGEDVANSLYYVHLDSPEDALLAKPRRPGIEPSPPSSNGTARSVIRRKPLPASAKKPCPESRALNRSVLPALPVSPAPSMQSQATEIAGTGVGAAVTAAVRPQATTDTMEGYRENPMFRNQRPATPPEMSVRIPQPRDKSPTTQTRPLSPRPPTTSIRSDFDAPASLDPAAQGRPSTPTQPGMQAEHFANRTVGFTSPTRRLHTDRALSPGKVERRPSSVSFSLTLIRRDPASGTQCNVGKVSSFQTNVPTPDSADPDLDPDNMGALHVQNIDIYLETSGYAKYRNMLSRASLDTYRPASQLSFMHQGMLGVGSGPGEDKAAALQPGRWPIRGLGEEGFSRQVVMSYGPSWKSNLKKAFRRRARSGTLARTGSSSPEGLAPPRLSHIRQGSASTVGSLDSANGRHSPTLITHPGPGLKPTGYFFLSPWDGRCEFRTSTNGRSLKCRHILDATSPRLDPREVAQNIRDARAMGRSRGDELFAALLGAKPVSELRFNLPNGPRPDPKQPSGQFSKLLQHGLRSSDEETGEEDDHGDYDSEAQMDLSLGKEQAGGGNRGRRAKLGKLIIHDEGLNMLDLVVAANVGVWWTAWGRAG